MRTVDDDFGKMLGATFGLKAALGEAGCSLRTLPTVTLEQRDGEALAAACIKFFGNAERVVRAGDACCIEVAGVKYVWKEKA